MTLNEQCCTVEQGKRLVELGVPTEGVIFWHMPAKSGPHGEWIRYGWHGDAIAPAFDVAELGELLPSTPYFRLRHDMPWRTTKVTGNGPDYWHAEDEIDICGLWPTEAQARAEILIHLLETKIDAF